ncbi:GntR family transcriptional regulator [Catelliglobosispora koreensis]|uniref:GntR family transcriptional regulator n=1 Tax=Catelliglobosispora koreensis TaxID=129052 RepID=UPI0003637310|nr:GntR family transcriptional regulator [Catelliglobosispora koreensis]
MFDDRSPIYQQIADKIKKDILYGDLSAGDQVMSTNQYASFYRINPATAAKAFQQLTDEGYLYKRRGIGMFVSDDAQAQLRQQRREHFFADVVAPMVAEAKAIGITLDEIIHHLTNKDGTPGESRD